MIYFVCSCSVMCSKVAKACGTTRDGRRKEVSMQEPQVLAMKTIQEVWNKRAGGVHKSALTDGKLQYGEANEHCSKCCG